MGPLIPEFGQSTAGIRYTLRPGGYGIVRDAAARIAVVATPLGLFLPGGGQEQGESPEAALVREAREESGLDVRVLHPVGIADELVFSASERTYFRKRCTFFTAAAESEAIHRCEPDHQLRWLPVADAITQLTHESQRWAVRTADKFASKK